MIQLGFGAARGFAGSDLTSPEKAAREGGFTDATPTEFPHVTELRVHGVSGSNGPTMLEHPTVLQVAGDSTTMFYRRWTPAGRGGASVPWKVEAYSWGGLTENALASAAWVLLTPFMLYNVAHFTLPPPRAWRPDAASDRLGRDKPHAVAASLLRLMALLATLQVTAGAIAVLVNSVGLQAGGGRGHVPGWLRWYRLWPTHARVAVAAVAVVALVCVLWLLSVRTAKRYEARTSSSDADLDSGWPLTQSGFWRGQELVRRQRALHAAAAIALTALVLARPIAVVGPLRWSVLVLAAGVIAAVLVALGSNFADRHSVTLRRSATSRARSAPRVLGRGLLALSLLAFVGSLFGRGWAPRSVETAATIPGFTTVCAVLLAVQFALLVVVAGVVLALRRRSDDRTDPASAPYARGQLTTLMTALAICIGGLFLAVLTLLATRLVGTPVPNGTHADIPVNAIQIPWPIYAFAAAPVGAALGLVVGAVILAQRFRRDVRAFQRTTGTPARSAVGREYGNSYGDPDDAAHRSNRAGIARAWAVGRLADSAGMLVGWLVAGMLLVVALAEGAALRESQRRTAPPSWLHAVTTVESLAGLFVAGWIVALVRTAYQDPARRKTIGALWDVATFWPRAAHPFGPPCYAERAVPELVDRVRLLAASVDPDPDDPAWQQVLTHDRDASITPSLSVPTCRVLLTGYSQGSILAPTVVAALPADVRARTSLLTLACPARRLYGRAFPAYFGPPRLATLADQLGSATGSPTGRWINLVRNSDYIGSWVLGPPDPIGTPPPVPRVGVVDQLALDPVAVTADRNPSPPPIHRHSGWWPDPRVGDVSRCLVEAADRTVSTPIADCGSATAVCQCLARRGAPAASRREGERV